MTSDLSNEFGSLKLNDDRVRMSTNTNSRRSYGSNQNSRPKLRTNRSATIDHGSHEERLRIVVLGATKVGKTCLCQQFLQQKFVSDHKETVDEMYTTELALVDRHITLEILDTAGIDEFPVMRRLAIARGDAFLIVYAVNDAYSFDIAKQMRQLVYEIKGELTTTPIPMIIVANKSDMNYDLHEIKHDYAETIVNNQWKNELIETTCHERQTVLKAFHQLLNLANINIALNSDLTTRRSSDPNLASDKTSRATNKRQSCAQQ